MTGAHRGLGSVTFRHVSLTARDGTALAAFYRQALGLVDRRPPKRLSGSKIARGNGLPGADILSIWLTLPDDDGPFLEILQHHDVVDRAAPAVNERGLGHLAFEVPDLNATIAAILRLGGAQQGQVTNFGTDDAPCLILYMRDPEGNLLELEQRRSPRHQGGGLP